MDNCMKYQIQIEQALTPTLHHQLWTDKLPLLQSIRLHNVSLQLKSYHIDTSNCSKHKKVKVSIHGHTLYRRKNFLEPWSCSAQFISDNGCKSENPNFLPGMGIKKWACKDCPFFLCKECIKTYTTHLHDKSSSSESDW